MILPKILYTISNTLKKHKAKMIIVGGATRDYFLELPSKDYDIEVYGLGDIQKLEEVLLEFGSVNFVGKSFGILKFVHNGDEYDFSFPRVETKVGKGHKGFDVKLNGNLDFKMASMRRDFSINAIGYDIEEKCFLDPFGGLEDIEKKQLRHIDNETFTQDPLRVYRAMQFCARFSFSLAKDTFKLCQKMVYSGMLEELPKERVYAEWRKLMLKSSKPSKGFELMRELAIIERYFQELYALIGVPQSIKWHPEGDVWVHTMMTIDEMSYLCKIESCCIYEEKQILKFMFVALCHDFGKAVSTTIEPNGTIRSIGHEHTGVALTKQFMYRLMDEHDFIEGLLPLIEHHLKPSQFYADNSSNKAILKLATRVNIKELTLVSKADFLGRTTDEALTRNYKAGDWLLKKASSLNVETKPIKRLLQGRDLINLGLSPSPKFKTMLDEVYDLQLDGAITTYEEALEYAKKNYIN